MVKPPNKDGSETSIVPSDLSLRTKKILQAVVSEYLQTGEAVGSRTVTRRHGIDLSPATVRNVMSDLEEMGLLDQPHTSAGRVPTGRGLRFFIDSLLKVRSLSPKEKEEIRHRIGGLDPDVALRESARALSEYTRYAGIVLAPNPERQTLKHIEFVPMSTGKYLCIMVTTDGHIENKIVAAEGPRDVAQLERIHKYLADLLGGLTMEQVRGRILAELGEEKNAYDQMVATALRMSKEAIDTERSADVIVAGGANLLDVARAGDEQSLQRMRELLHALEDKEILVRLLDEAMTANRIQVFLGAESQIELLGDTSVVAMPYGPGEQPIGAIAVIGPTRMNYGKVMSVVDFTAEMVSRLLEG